MERPAKRPAQRCLACGRVSPGSAIRCDCGARFDAPRARPAAAVAKRGWDNVGGALCLAAVLGGTSAVITAHGEWPVARTLFAVAAVLALAGAAWAFARLPPDQRTWRAFPRRSALIVAGGTALLLGGIAYGIHDYLGSTYAAGHDCASDKECRSSHCFGARDDSPGVCTDFCDDDADCPEHMICTLGRSVTAGEQFSGGGEEVHFCTFGRRAAPP